MVELEQLNQYRFYTLKPTFPLRCDAMVENIYSKVMTVSKEIVCNGMLKLHMIDDSIRMICSQNDCRQQYDIPRTCTNCDRQTVFEDITCDTCEPIVINITTWNVSIDECNKAIKKINRAFKQNIITEEEWRNSLKIQKDELLKCQKDLEKQSR